MRLADARLAASIMIPCSMIELFTGRAWLWMMKTSEPRTDSANREWTSPSANSERLGSPSFTLRQSAISSARGRLERPLKSWRRFLVTSSMTLPSSSALVVPAPSSVEPAGAGSRGHMRARRQPGERPDDGSGTDLRLLAHGLGDGGAFTDRAVGEAHGGPEAGTRTDDGV